MPTRLILVRHGDSEHKADGTTGGPLSCKGLTEKGRWEAERLRDRWTREGWPVPATVYASVLPRAVQTAQIVTQAFAETREVVQDCDFCSWHIPAEWDGQSWESVRAAFSLPGGGVYRPFEVGAESWAQLVGRVGRGLYGVAQRHHGQTVLVVSHKEAINASLIVLGALPLMLPFDGEVANTGITEWVTDGNPTVFPSPRWTLVRFNDAAHLTR